jgi:glutaredoxin 3
VVEIYTKNFCSFCSRAKSLLKEKGVEFIEIAVDLGGKDRELMIERANGRSTVPQIFIRGEHVGGCAELFRLDDEGRLDQLLSG